MSLETPTSAMASLSQFGVPNLISFSQLTFAIPHLRLIKNSFAEEQFVESEREDKHVEDCFIVAAPYFERYLPLKLTSDSREEIAGQNYDPAMTFKSHFALDALQVAWHFRATDWDAKNVDGASCVLLLWKQSRTRL